jgi:hypothetical protein
MRWLSEPADWSRSAIGYRRSEPVTAHRSPHPSGTRHVLVFGSLLALFFLLITRNVSPEPYGYDEADYMYAASLGYAANWTDTPSISIADFLGAGLSRGRDNPKALSERIRGSHDVLFYRHFHGPLYHYFLIPLSRLGLSERGVRVIMLAIPAASLAVIYFGCLWLAPRRSARLAALLVAMLFLTSHSVVWSTELAPHQLFALCSLACLVLLAKAIATGRRAYWYACIIVSALAFCTLEVAFVLILTVSVCAFVERAAFGADLRFVVKSLALFVATVLAVWPAAILRLSCLKAYAVMAYLALMRESPWGHVGFIETWRARILESPLEWALIAIALLGAFRNRRPRFYPVGLFVVLMLLATLRVFTSTPRYALTFMPALDLFAGLTLLTCFGPLRRPASFALVTLAVAGLYGIAWLQVANRPRYAGSKTLTPSRPAMIACDVIFRNSPCSTTPTTLFNCWSNSAGAGIWLKLQSTMKLPLSVTNGLSFAPGRSVVCAPSFFSFRSVACHSNCTTSTGTEECAPSQSTSLLSSAMMISRRLELAITFSRSKAPPAPLIKSSVPRWISSAPSMVKSISACSASEEMRIPSPRACFAVYSDVGMPTIRSPSLTRLPSASTASFAVEPVPSPTIIPLSTSPTAASAAACLNC